MFFSTAYAFYGFFMSSSKFFYSFSSEKRERVDMAYLRHLKENKAPHSRKKVMYSVSTSPRITGINYIRIYGNGRNELNINTFRISSVL
jgi:hypothetical protein